MTVNIEYKPYTTFEEIMDYLQQTSPSERLRKHTTSGQGHETSASSFNREKLFLEFCEDVKLHLRELAVDEIDKNGDSASVIKRSENVLIGKKADVKFYYSKIEQFAKDNNKTGMWYPKDYYTSLANAVYNENWGYPKIAFWIEDVENTSTDLIIDRNRISVKENGTVRTYPQMISDAEIERIEKKLLMMNKEHQNYKDNYKEVYTNNHIRVTIYNKKGMEQKTRMVLRKYVVRDFTLQKMVEMKTVPQKAVPIIEALVKMKTNIIITGEMGSAKTTLLNTLMKYKDKAVKSQKVCFLVQDDPEIQYEMFKETTVIPFIKNWQIGEDVEKQALRSSADYFVFGEGREKQMMGLFINLVGRGGHGNLLTYHVGQSDMCLPTILSDFPENQKAEILLTQNVDFIISMRSRDDGSKCLDTITMVQRNETGVEYHNILENIMIEGDDGHHYETWKFNYAIDKRKDEQFMKLAQNEYKQYKKTLKRLVEEQNATGQLTITEKIISVR